MASVRMTMLAPALALALPLPAGSTMRVAVCGQSGTIDIPIHRKDDSDPFGKCPDACHAFGCERSRRLRGRT